MKTVAEMKAEIIAQLDVIHPALGENQRAAAADEERAEAERNMIVASARAHRWVQPLPVGLDQQGRHQTRRAVGLLINDLASTDPAMGTSMIGYEAADVRAVTASDVAAHPAVLQAAQEIERHERLLDRLRWVMAGLLLAGAAALKYWPQ